jgi:hypothetical protein
VAERFAKLEEWAAAVLVARGHSALDCYVYLIHLLRCDFETWESRASVQQMAELVGSSPSRVRRSEQDLFESGLLVRESYSKIRKIKIVRGADRHPSQTAPVPNGTRPKRHPSGVRIGTRANRHPSPNQPAATAAQTGQTLNACTRADSHPMSDSYIRPSSDASADADVRVLTHSSKQQSATHKNPYLGLSGAALGEALAKRAAAQRGDDTELGGPSHSTASQEQQLVMEEQPAAPEVAAAYRAKLEAILGTIGGKRR